MNWINAQLARIPDDKRRHAAVMAWVAVAALLAAWAAGLDGTWPIVISWSAVTAIGLWKEFGIDTCTDAWDMVANYVGALAVWLAYFIG